MLATHLIELLYEVQGNDAESDVFPRRICQR